MDDNHLRGHAEALVFRQIILQITGLVDLRKARDISEEEFLEAIEEKCNVHRHLKMPQLRMIIDMLEKL